jgi:hypothetical protein
MEVDFLQVRGESARLAVWGWLFSLALAFVIAGVLQAAGFVVSTLLIGVALSTTAIGTLLPILRDAGELETSLGPFTEAAGFAGEFGPIIAISLVLSQAAGPGVNAVILITFAVISLGLGVLALRARSNRVVRTIERTMNSSGQFCRPTRDPDPRCSGLPDREVRVGCRARRPRRGNHRRPRHEERGRRARPVEARGHRMDVPRHDRLPLVLTSATALPLIVAVTEIGLEEGRMLPENAAALVGALVRCLQWFTGNP